MRSAADLLTVKLSLTAQLSLDWERIEQDRVWRQVALGLDVSDPEQKRAALEAYVEHYIARERLLEHVPSTNGPGQVQIKTMEIE